MPAVLLSWKSNVPVKVPAGAPGKVTISISALPAVLLPLKMTALGPVAPLKSFTLSALLPAAKVTVPASLGVGSAVGDRRKEHRFRVPHHPEVHAVDAGSSRDPHSDRDPVADCGGRVADVEVRAVVMRAHSDRRAGRGGATFGDHALLTLLVGRTVVPVEERSRACPERIGLTNETRGPTLNKGGPPDFVARVTP